MVILRSCAFGVALLVGSACADSDQSDQETELTTSSTTTPSTTSESPSTTDATSTTTSVDLDPDTQAAIDFIDAWAQGDAERMRELAPAEQVEIAMGFGTAEGEPDCSTQTSGQYKSRGCLLRDARLLADR